MYDSKTKRINFKVVRNQVFSTIETVLPTGQTHLQSHVMLNGHHWLSKGSSTVFLWSNAKEHPSEVLVMTL